MFERATLLPAFLLLLLPGCGSPGGTGSPDAGGTDAAAQDGATQDASPGSEASADGAGTDGATPACTTAADCPTGQVCIVHDECLPPPATPGCRTVMCAPDPCAGQPLSCSCAGCGICSVDPDAGIITCSSGG
jgi:hypothetical protein